MREITIDGKETRLRATPLALLYYKQEFDRDLIGDLIKMQGLEHDPEVFDSVIFLQLIWALAKADKPKDFPSFPAWVSKLDSIDFSDQKLLIAVMEEAVDGFFRGQEKKGKH